MTSRTPLADLVNAAVGETPDDFYARAEKWRALNASGRISERVAETLREAGMSARDSNRIAADIQRSVKGIAKAQRDAAAWAATLEANLAAFEDHVTGR